MSDVRAHPSSMSSTRWQRVQDLFAAALDRDAESRARLLGDRCGDDLDLRREVESLLASHDRPGLLDRLSSEMAPAAGWARAQVAGWEGRRVGQYSILDLVDAGGMGIVYKAHDNRLDRYVALKFLPPHLSKEKAPKERFLVEARAAAALDHPNICTVLEIGETEDGQLFIAMPFYDGETVQARLKRGRMPFADVVPVVVQVARGVGAAHTHGVVHRDIKPSNVMLLRDGTVKVLDFGIAIIEDSGLQDNAARFGTLAYMSPEHVRGGPIDQRSDIWSLGVLLHEMLTGIRPFDGGGALTDGILNREPELSATSHPDVPAGIEGVFRRALAKPPDDRYPSMALFAADLMALGSAAGSLRPRDEAPVSERRHLAVLNTIVSDYGGLVERMTPADAQRLVAQVRDLAVDVVRRHGGIVNQAIGEEIVSVFGVPAAHDDDELRAVRAALELHRRVGELAHAGLTGPLQIQSALHAGVVVAQRLNEGPRRYAIVGSPTAVASRLATLAAPGDLLLSAECQRLLSPFLQTVALDPVVVEAGTQAVTPFRVTGQTGLETRLEASERAGLSPYVGRENDLAELARSAELARLGHGQIIEIVGEAGVGKSRLMYELRERVMASGDASALMGRCRAFGDVAPYSPFIEIVRSALSLDERGAVGSSDLVRRFRAIDASLEPFLPLFLHLLSVQSESHALPPHLQGEHLQAALGDALAAFFAAVSNRSPLLVLLEDWHWVDSGSRAALARISEIVFTERLLFVVTRRPGHLEAPVAPGASRLRLEPLDFAASAAIVGAGLGMAHVSEGLARRLFERTGGNPFFLEQVCRALVEQHTVRLRDGEAVVDGGPETLSLPDTVQAVIRSRLDTLESHARAVVRIAAAFGREFEHALLADVAGPSLDLAPAIARLLDSGLIGRSGESPRLGYRFTHVLTQEVSYESLLGHQRKSLHEAIGRAIERHHPAQIDERSALLAHHYSRAEAWPEAVRYGMRAADRASGLSQFGDAFETLERVLEWLPLLPNDEESWQLRADVLFRQERSCETMGLRRRQQEIIRSLIAHLAPAGLSARLGEAYLREGDLLTLLKKFNAADRALATALRISRELPDARLERNVLRSIGLLRWHEGRHREALELTEHALAIDRESGDEDAAAGDLVNLSNILRSMGDYPAALSHIQQALAMPSVDRNPKKLAYALHNIANVHRGMGNVDAALASLRRADLNAAHLLPIQRSFHLTSMAHIELQQGSIEQAISTYKEAIDLSRRARHAEGLAQSMRTLGEVLFGLGRYDEAVPYLFEAAALFAQLEDVAGEADLSSRAAAACERTGRYAESLNAWKRVQALSRQTGESIAQLDAVEGIARSIRLIQGASDEAIAAFESALDLASTLGEWPRALTCRNTLGILAWARERHADALVHYEAALLLARNLDDPVQEGVILNSLGMTLSKLNRAEEARTVLEESAALNRRTGQGLLEAHALAGLGHAARALGRLEQAVRYFEQSRDLRRAAGDLVGEAWMWRRLADVHLLRGQDDAARQAAESATRVAAASGDVDTIAACTATRRVF